MSTTSNPTSSDAPAMRTVVDGSGESWRVSEVSAAGVPGARGESCLLAETPSIWRRVWHYPTDWLTCPVEQLLDAIALRWPTATGPRPASGEN